jgi:hypothetical protein
MTTTDWVLIISINVCFWLARNWAAPYVKGRAELGARDDMLDTILNEVRHSTHIQKEIESKITGRDWNRQRAYELRRDCYINLLRTLGRFAISIRELKRLGVPTEDKQLLDPGTEQFRRLRAEADSLITP